MVLPNIDDAPPPSVNEMLEAVALLKSIGIEHLCRTFGGDSFHSDLIFLCGDHKTFLEYRNLLQEKEVETPFRHEFVSLADEERFYIINICGALFCVAFVALVSALFLGLLTLDVMDLRIIERASIDEDERICASRLIPIVKERHRLLVTLLILNALAYETLPLFLDNLVPSWVAILLSTTFILVFGEILPSGIFMGPQQLYLGSKMVPIVRVFLWMLYPIAMPLALWLDVLTKEGDPNAPPAEAYDRAELSALVRIQHEQLTKRANRLGSVMKQAQSKDQSIVALKSKDQSWAALKTELMERVSEINNDDDDGGGGAPDEQGAPAVEQLTPPLHQHEVNLVEGALKMKTSLAMDVYTPLSHVYAVPDDLVLDKSTIAVIYSQGYSRVPVYRRNTSDPDDQTSVLGFLITRQLMLIDWDDKRELSTLPLQRPICVSPRMNLIHLFDNFQKNAPIMTFVCARPDLARKALAAKHPIPVAAGYMGIVTLEDIMESILQQKIYDEGDIRDRDRAIATLTNWADTKLQSFLRESIRRRQRERKQRNPGYIHHNDMSSSSSQTNEIQVPDESTSLLFKSSRTSLKYTDDYEGVRGDTLV